MPMSSKTARKMKQKELEGVQIRCRYCDSKDTCKSRARKESYENAGVMTYCKITPNRPKKPKKPKQYPY